MIVNITGGTHLNTIKFTNTETGEEIKGVRSFDIHGEAGSLVTVKLEFVAGSKLNINAKCADK